MRWRLSVLTVLSLVAAALTVPTAPKPSEAAPPAPRQVIPVAPGVQRADYRLTKPSGSPVAAQVLTITPTPGVRITSALANGRVAGLENIRDMNRRLQPAGGVAVINSSFWLNRPVGDPESYFASAGRLISESETQGATQRGTFALTPEGAPLMDRVLASVHLNVDGRAMVVTGLNRLDKRFADRSGQPNPFNDPIDAVYVYTPEFGASVTVPSPYPAGRTSAAALTLTNFTFPASHGAGDPAPASAPVPVAPGTTLPIPPDGAVVLGYDGGASVVRSVAPGAPVRGVTEIATEATPQEPWRAVTEGVAAGPLLVRDRQMVDPATWEGEGFSPGHSTGVAPRSAVGYDAEGRIFLAAVDGRQPGHSVGMSMAELARFMIDLGAVHAMSLDGGGSTQLAVDGIIRNSPCQAQGACGPLRPVASGLVVQHDYDYANTRRLSGAGREDTAAEIARAGHPQGSDDAVLAPASDFPDALAGGPRAAQLDAPLLLAGKDALAPATRQALRDLRVRRITILGGTGVISAAVADQLVRDGYEVRRVSGSGRVETAAAIAATMGATHDRIFVAAAGGFADALSAAAPAGILRAPILLTARDSLSGATRDLIATSQPREVIVVGGGGVIAARVEAELQAINPSMTVRRISGSDRYGTARAINEWAEATIPDLDDTALVVARGDTFPDALAGGPLAARQRGLLMIVPAWDIRAAASGAAYLDARGERVLGTVTLLGGLGVLSSYQQWQLDQLAR